MCAEFRPMRSLIYVDCVKEQYRVKLRHWLYRYHVPDSISHFEPYCTKYCFYPALPSPTDPERFGVARMQLTEHYWLINELLPEYKSKTITEYFPTDVLKWQGIIPEEAEDCLVDGDEARSAGRGAEGHPFIFAFVPICFEDDMKGAGRTIEDGPNYRWQFMLSYPDGVSQEDGDKWFYEELAPALQNKPEVTRLLSSKIMQDVNGCPFNRVVEVWFEGPDQWNKVIKEIEGTIKKPEWAMTDIFPFLPGYTKFVSIFLSDYAESNNLAQYRGYIAMR